MKKAVINLMINVFALGIYFANLINSLILGYGTASLLSVVFIPIHSVLAYTFYQEIKYEL